MDQHLRVKGTRNLPVINMIFPLLQFVLSIGDRNGKHKHGNGMELNR